MECRSRSDHPTGTAARKPAACRVPAWLALFAWLWAGSGCSVDEPVAIVTVHRSDTSVDVDHLYVCSTSDEPPLYGNGCLIPVDADGKPVDDVLTTGATSGTLGIFDPGEAPTLVLWFLRTNASSRGMPCCSTLTIPLVAGTTVDAAVELAAGTDCLVTTGTPCSRCTISPCPGVP
jgi:hypothetical protein